MENEDQALKNVGTSKIWCKGAENKGTMAPGINRDGCRHPNDSLETSGNPDSKETQEREKQPETVNDLKRMKTVQGGNIQDEDVQIQDKHNWIQVGNAYMILNNDTVVQEELEQDQTSQCDETEGTENSIEAETNQIVIAPTPSK